jgi:GH24 family phage-related lysozyme (muramidase)
MFTNPEVIAIARPMIGSDEGCRLSAYLDSRGIPTIGWGRAGPDVHLGMNCTQAMADMWRDSAILNRIQGLDWNFPWWRTLDPIRAAVLIDMAYQLGVHGLTLWHNTLAALKAEDWQSAHDNMLKSKAAIETPNRYKRLADQVLTGVVQKGS